MHEELPHVAIPIYQYVRHRLNAAYSDQVFPSVVMLGIHRTFFAQALLDHPANPLRSPYAPSFLAANRCASVLIKSFLHHFERCPDLCGRYWSIWTHAFTAAVSLYLFSHVSPSHRKV